MFRRTHYLFHRLLWSTKHRYMMLLILAVTLLVLSSHILVKRYSKGNIKTHPCEVSSEHRQQLFPLLDAVIKVWSHLGVSSFLCYNSLWGAIQESGPLPWDMNAQLCLINSELAKHDEVTLLREFRRQGMDLVYSSAEGEYTISNSSNSENIQISILMILFEEDERLGMYRRVGWKRRLLPPDCDAHPTLQCFPPDLIRHPLPMRTFGPLLLPAPREDIDLLKFHYPNTWWKPLKPNC